MAAVSPEEQPKRPQNRNLQELKNKACFFTISDFVEDRVRVRCLNIVAFTLIYIYFVFALLKTVPRPEPQVKLVRYANPPPASWLSGNLGDDLRGFYSGLGMIPNRSQRIFVVDDTGTPMINAQVEVKVTNFVAEGPLPCSKAQLDAMASTIEARRLEHVCKYDEVEHNTGATDPTGLVSFSNFTIKGPAGLYTVVPSVGGVDSTQEGAMLVSTPVASMEVVDDTLPEFPPVPPPLAAKIGEPFAWQPRVLVRDMRGLPVPGRKVVAFANPDPTWPIMGPSARTPEYDRRGQKVVELNCPESELSDDRGIAQFTCLGVKSSNVDHVNIVFSDSALVFYPWNDPVYSPRSAYPLIVQSYRYSIYIVPNARRVQVDTPVPGVAVEGIPFNPPPVVNVTDENGSPLAGVTCYAYASIESGGRNPNWYRRQLVGVRNKELLDAVAITDASGKAEFTNLRWSVEGNTMDLELLKFVPAEVANLLSVFSISFNCEGIDQDTHAWSPWSGSFIWHVEPIVAEIRIKRFIRKSAEMARYLHEGKADGSDTFLAVVRVVDDKGNGIPGKTVDVKHHADEEDGRVTVSLLEGSIEQTNDLGFAVVAFQAITGPPELEQTGSFTFQVRFLLDGATSQPSEVLTARLVGGVKPEECHIIEPGNAYFYRLSTGQVFPLMGFPVTVSSGDIFFSTNSLIGATSCVTFPSISTPNTTTCTSRRLREEDAPDFKTLHRRLKEADSPTIGRKLLSADGSMAAQARSVYSSVTDKWGKVRFEPRDFLEIAVLPQIPLPSLREYNANPQFPLAAIFNGPSGDHWVRMHVETTEPDGTKRTCSSRMIPVRIENDIGDIEVHGDGGPGSMFEDTQIEAGGYIDIDVRLVLDNAFVNASNLSNIPECIRLSATYLEACTISFVFRNAPFTYHQKLGLSSEPRSASLLSEYHAIFPVQKTNSTNTDGFDPTTGTLHLRFQMLEKGIFGDFGIQFSGFGVKSRVFTWRVKPPPGLRLEVVQDPGYSLVRPLTGNLMDILPKVKVLSDSGPVNGAILAFEAVPEEGGRFEKLTEVPLYSAFPFLYSEASGKAAVDGFGQSLGPAEDGLAYFPTMGMPDGSGCARFRFLVGGVSSPLVPATPICCEAAFEYSIVNTPPSSWPLKMELQDFGGAITVELSPRHELPQFTEYLGGLLVRLVVSGEGGQDITDRDMAFELSQRLLSDSVCVFLNRVEQLGRCSNLEVVQTHPFPVLRFSFLRVTWMRAMSLPGKMKLRVSDLSGSGFSAGEALPAGFADMNSVQKFAICAAAASASKELLEQSMTSEIVAETTASQYMVVLPPPETVTVGSMFLVRLKVTTASGGPVRDVRVRVGIKSLTTTAPGRTSPGLLQSLAVQGNSLGVVSTGNIKLDPLTTVRSSDGSGIIGFPLTVLKAGSGTYQLQFQPDVPDGKIVLTTSAFKVENPITAISSSSRISEMKIPKFGTSVPVPVAPQFCIETATNESLQQMDKDGIRISIVLRLKAAPEERESAAMSLVAQAKRDANEQAQRIANDMATRLAQTPNTAMRRAVDTMVARANSKAKGMFAGMSEEFAEACFATPAKLLQTGDPAVMVNFGNATVDFVGEQAPSLAEALGMDPTALDPTQSLNQFTEVLMSAGAALTPAREMAVEGSWELTLNDLDFKGGCTYEPNQSLVFPFKEGMDYSFSLSVNGVEGPSEPFKVLLIPADPVDLAFNWFLSAVAAIVGVVLLTTNVTLHHWAWFVIAMLCTLGMCIGLPWMTLHKDAMYGSWLYIAIANFALIAVALVWGLTAQLSPKIKTFEDKRADIFEEYTHRQFKTLIGFNEGKRDPRRSALRDTFLKPFNSQDAFFFPSAFLIASFLSFLSFIYVLMQSIQVLNNTEKLLQQILNTAVDRSVLFVSSINNAYFQALGADLPDSSSDFMYVQIQVMKDWFQKLITSIVIGFTTGIVVAAILTVAGLLGGFVHFRQSVMDARRGKFNFKKSDAKLVFATAFIGINISSSIVSFILIVGLVTLVTLPFTFELTWRVIWSYAGTILLTFVLPAVIKFLSTKILKGCIFGPTFIKTRAGASIFHFYTTFLALPGGVVTAIVRFVMGLLSVLVMLPITYGANTPNMVNSVMLLDSSYKTYIAYVMLYATHNNPIMITAARRLLAIKEAREKHREEKKHWTSSRSLLILILIRFPHLRQYRKHVLEEERKLQKILKDKKYAKSMKDKKGEESENVFIKVQEGSAKVEEPWIANAYEDALQDGIKIQRKIELMKKYRTMLSGLQEDTPEYKEMKDKLRELSLPLRRDSPVLGV